jgi:hypothetical protein
VGLNYESVYASNTALIPDESLTVGKVIRSGWDHLCAENLRDLLSEWLMGRPTCDD